MKRCCICNAAIEHDDAPALVMSISGNPKLLCDDCVKVLDDITLGKDYDTIEAQIDKIGKIMSNNELDNLTFETMNSLLASAVARAKLIKEGKYDFALDEQKDDEEGFDEIPEELQETEEDREKDREDEEKMKKFDKIFNIIAATLVIVTIGFIAWRIVESFILK